MRIRVANVAIIHRTHVFHTLGFRTAIESHGGNFEESGFDFFESPSGESSSPLFILVSVAISMNGAIHKGRRWSVCNQKLFLRLPVLARVWLMFMSTTWAWGTEANPFRPCNLDPEDLHLVTPESRCGQCCF